MRLYYNFTTIYDLPPTMSAEIIKLRERAKGLLTVRFGRPFVSLLLAPKHTTNSSLPKLMPQYVDALQKTTNLARMKKLADAAETLSDRSKDPDTILASVLAVKTSVVSPSFGNFIGRKKKAKGTSNGTPKKSQKPPPPTNPPPGRRPQRPNTPATNPEKLRDQKKIEELTKQAEDCSKKLEKVRTDLLTLETEKASIDADNEEKKMEIKKLEKQIEVNEKKCKEEIEKLKKKLEAAEKTNLESVPKDKVEQMQEKVVKKIKKKFESEKKTLEARIETLQKAQTASTASVDAKIESLTTAKTKLEGEKNQLEIDLKKLTISNSKLEESNRTLQGERDALATEKGTLTTEKTALDETVKGLKRDLNKKKTLEKQTNKLKETNKNLEASLEQIRAPKQFERCFTSRLRKLR